MENRITGTLNYDQIVVGFATTVEKEAELLNLTLENIGTAVLEKMRNLLGDELDVFKDAKHSAPVRAVCGEVPDGRKIRVHYIGGAVVKVGGKDKLGFYITRIEPWKAEA
jgi:hypothetical protein